MGEKLYQGISFWMMTFAIALWGVTTDRTPIEPSHIIMALMAASIWTFAFGWGSISAATEPLSTLDKYVVCTITTSLLIAAIAATLAGWPANAFFRDAPIVVLPMSVGVGLSYMFGATLRRHLPDAKPADAKSPESWTLQQ
jgi:hypothetical protein